MNTDHSPNEKKTLLRCVCVCVYFVWVGGEFENCQWSCRNYLESKTVSLIVHAWQAYISK